MHTTESRREHPTGDDEDRIPTGPIGPRPRPASWAAGMAPFGRVGLSLPSTSLGRSPGNLTNPLTHYSRTASGAGTYCPQSTLAVLK